MPLFHTKMYFLQIGAASDSLHQFQNHLSEQILNIFQNTQTKQKLPRAC